MVAAVGAVAEVAVLGVAAVVAASVAVAQLGRRPQLEFRRFDSTDKPFSACSCSCDRLPICKRHPQDASQFSGKQHLPPACAGSAALRRCILEYKPPAGGGWSCHLRAPGQ